MVCARCGEENPARFRFCGACGAALTTHVATAARKVVTLVFADVTGSTALAERLDPESVRWVMSSFFETARGVLERHGGTVEKFIGDAVMAAFGIPRVHEDDALRGVRAAGELRDRLLDFGREVEDRYGAGIGVRIGVNTGEVVAGDAAAGQAFASGDAVNVAARLEQAARAGEVLLGEATLRLVRDAVTVEDAGPLTLKGKSENVAAWRLVDVTAGGPGVMRGLDAPLVGREGELAELRECWRRTVAERTLQVVAVVAPAGSGKTRLMAALAEFVQPEARVVIGSCLPYGESTTFWPIAEAVRQAAGVDDMDSIDAVRQKFARLVEAEEGACEILERLGPAFGLPGPQAALAETFWAIRRLLEALARRRPLVVILDDVHWGEETLFDLIDYLAGCMRGVPLLLACAARPELLERRPSSVGSHANVSTLLLDPLGREAADEVMAWQLGAPLAREIGERILRSSEGNPLFVQELVRMLIDDGLIVRRDGSWQATAEVRELAMPPTIQALLAARLDQLEAADREIAQRAAVIGQVFSWSAVRELCGEAAAHDLSGRLHTLVRKQLIVPEASANAVDDSFRFGHILVRDAAYAGLAKRTRAELHERFADWLARDRGRRLSEHEEILGYHFEQAATCRQELGDTSDARRLADQASVRLCAAGQRALTTGDLPAAANLLIRAADILPGDEPRRLAIRLLAIPALAEIGRLEQADAALAEILAESHENSLLVAARAWRGYLDEQRGFATQSNCAVLAEEWLSACEEAGDPAGQATALGFLAKMQFWTGHAAAADEIWDRAAAQAALAGDAREESEALVMLLISAMFGPVPVPAALERCEAIANRSGASHQVRVMASIQRGVLEAMQGHTARGRDLVARGRAQLEEFGLTLRAQIMAQEAAIVEQMAGDASAAEALLRPAFDRLREMGATGFQMGTAGMLSRALDAQGKLDGAKWFAELCTFEGEEDFAGFANATSALVAAREGDDRTAVWLAEAAVAQVSASDWLWFHADRLVDLADIHTLAGRSSEALAALAEADVLYERKGCVAALRWTASRRSALTTLP